MKLLAFIFEQPSYDIDYSKQKTSLMESSKLDGNMLTVENLNNLLPTCAYPEGRTRGPDPPPPPHPSEKSQKYRVS